MIDLGPQFEAAVATQAQVPPMGFDVGSLSIDLVNPAGTTTVRFTQTYQVDTAVLKQLIQKFTE